MKGASRAKIAISLVVAVLIAAIAASVAAPNGGSAESKAYYYVGGHPFGVGEEQVYVIVRQSTLTVRLRDDNDVLRTQTFAQTVKSSIAWTVEGIASGGGPILAVARAAPPAKGSPSPGSPSPQAPDQAVSSVPVPSPILNSQGAGAATGAMADLAPASFILASLTSAIPDIGKPWSSSGGIALRYGSLALHMNNEVLLPTGDQGSIVKIASNGTTGLDAKVKVKGFGTTSLRGGGSATSLTFIESQNRLLLGMNLSAQSRGNAHVKKRAGSYDLSVSVALKLVRYIPGVPLYIAGPGFVPASGFLGRTAAPADNIYSTAVPDQMAHPVATNTEFIPPPASPITPYPSTLPEVSLPPIPIPQGSDQPVASPPPPPTPTPTPTRYF